MAHEICRHSEIAYSVHFHFPPPLCSLRSDVLLNLIHPLGPLQEIIKSIKVREWIPHIGLIRKVLVLDHSFFEDNTRATHGQPERLSRNYLRQSGVKCSKTFHTTDVLSHSQPSFCSVGFCLLCARLAVYSFTVHSVLQS